jgi:hypothetical protein
MIRMIFGWVSLSFDGDWAASTAIQPIIDIANRSKPLRKQFKRVLRFIPDYTTFEILVSGQNTLNRVSMHIGKPALDTIMVEGQAFMIHPEEMKDRGMKIVPGNRVL